MNQNSFSSVQNLINIGRNASLRTAVLIQTLNEAAVFLYNNRKKWVSNIHCVNTSSLCAFSQTHYAE